MPNGTITSTENTFGTVNGALSGTVAGTLTGSVGVPGPVGPQGPQGQQGIQGVPGAPGIGIPTGGTAGQFLTKTNSLDYATNWSTFSLAGYATESWVTSQGYLIASTAATTYAPIAAGQPTSGTVGQVLTKNSGTNYDSSWQTLIPGDRYVTTSSTSLSVGNGTKSLTIGTGLAYTPNQDVTISLTSDPTLHHMHGVVTSYNSGTGALVVNIQNHTGSGTYTGWTVNVGGTVPLQTVEWGEVLGVLGDQTDLATALNSKLEVTDAASTYQPLSGMSDYLAKAGNLAGLSSNSSARSNLGLGSLATVNDAPSDGSTYGRNNGAWVVAGGGSFPADALTTNEVNAVANAEFTVFSIPASVSLTYGSGVLSFQDTQIGADGKQISLNSGNAFTLSNLGTSWSIGLMTDSLDPGYPKYVEDLVGFINGQSVSLTASWSGTTGTDTVDGLPSYSPLTLDRSVVDIQSGDRLMIEQGIREYLTSNALSLSAAANTVLTYAGPDQNTIVAWAKPWQSEGYITSVPSTLGPTTFTGLVNTAASTGSSAGLRIPHAVAAPSSPVNGDVWTTTSGLFYQINGATVSPATLSGGTYTGLITTATPTTTSAGFRLPHGTAPTTPVDGDVWTTTGGLFWRQGGATKQAMNLGDTQTVSGNITFSNASLTLSNSIGAGTINIGTGATNTGNTKSIVIGANGAAGSTTGVTVGSTTSTQTINIAAGNTASGVTNTVNIASGSSVSGGAKVINIGANGAAGSTCTITVGSAGGTTTTVNGSTAFNGLVSTPASTTTTSGFRILPGAAPTTPTNGDIWTTTARMFARINGVTQGIVSQSDIGTSGNTSVQTVNIATDANASGQGKNVNLGTGSGGGPTFVNVGSSSAQTNINLRGKVTFDAPGATTQNTAPIIITSGTPAGLIGGDIYYNTSGVFGGINSSVGCQMTAVRAFVNFSGTSTGTWAGGASTVTRTAGSTVCTVTTTTAHGLVTDNVVRVLTGVTAGNYVVQWLSATQFSFTTVETTALSAVPITFAVNTIRASQNVTSIADNGAGDYTVNFVQNIFPDVNYTALVGGCTTAGGGATNGLQAVEFITNSTTLARTTAAYRFYTLNSSGANTDALSINAVFLR